MNLEEMTCKEVEREDDQVALIPTGSTEQHGPHGPLGTDTIIAKEIARSAANQTQALVLPAISVGISEEHREFQGSLYISSDTFRNQLTEIILSAQSSEIAKYVVVNGHGGNISAIKEVCKNLYLEYTTIVMHWTWFDAISAKNMGHGGELETSLIKYLRPELVKEPLEPGAENWGLKLHGSKFDYLTSSFTQNGVVGDPTKATKKKGKKLFSQATNKLTNLIEDLKNSNYDF